MPAPLRVRPQRHALLVIFGKRLKARDVGGEGELAVADAQRGQRIGLVERDIMPRHQRLAVDAAGIVRVSRSPSQQQACQNSE